MLAFTLGPKLLPQIFLLGLGRDPSYWDNKVHDPATNAKISLAECLA